MMCTCVCAVLCGTYSSIKQPRPGVFKGSQVNMNELVKVMGHFRGIYLYCNGKAENPEFSVHQRCHQKRIQLKESEANNTQLNSALLCT